MNRMNVKHRLALLRGMTAYWIGRLLRIPDMGYHRYYVRKPGENWKPTSEAFYYALLLGMEQGMEQSPTTFEGWRCCRHWVTSDQTTLAS